jgi:hypothetical protein
VPIKIFAFICVVNILNLGNILQYFIRIIKNSVNIRCAVNLLEKKQMNERNEERKGPAL